MRNFLRSNASANPAATTPEIAAATAYADTTSPNCRGAMDSAGMRIAPSGLMIMKSRMTLNCRKASTPMTNFWYGVKMCARIGPLYGPVRPDAMPASGLRHAQITKEGPRQLALERVVVLGDQVLPVFQRRRRHHDQLVQRADDHDQAERHGPSRIGMPDVAAAGEDEVHDALERADLELRGLLHEVRVVPASGEMSKRS